MAHAGGSRLMWDLNSKTKLRECSTQWFIDRLDLGILHRNAAQPPREYLGASYVGRECERQVQYSYMHQAVDDGREFGPDTLRIFERGHVMEDMAAGWIRQAGFEIVTHKPDGGQLGFTSGNGKFKGHCDGVITAWKGEGESQVALPCLWEHKAMGDKSWKNIRSRGVRKAKPEYFAQMQVYMHHLDLTDNPALFMVTNANSMEVHVEMVPFDPAACQATIDRAVRVIQATEAGEILPRASADPEWFLCRYCDYKETCWS